MGAWGIASRLVRALLLALGTLSLLTPWLLPWLQAQRSTLAARRLLRLGSDRQWRGDRRGAADLYERALDLEPGLPRVRLHLALIYLDLHQPGLRGRPGNDALLGMAIRRLTQVASDHTDPWARHAALLHLAAAGARLDGEDGAALRFAEPALRQLLVGEAAVEAAFALARVLERTGRPDEAVALVGRLAASRPGDPAVAREQALQARRLGRFDDALLAYQRWSRLAPGDAEPLVARAALLWDRAFRDHRAGAAARAELARRGLAAAEQALRLEPQRKDARAYRDLLSELARRLGGEGG